MNTIERTRPTAASPWLISVIVLSLPSVIFVKLATALLRYSVARLQPASPVK
jgi:hypothetical protein